MLKYGNELPQAGKTIASEEPQTKTNGNTRTSSGLGDCATHLSIPQQPSLKRQNSTGSLFTGSDISELSFGSTEADTEQHRGLISTLSNVSANLAVLPTSSTWKATLEEFWTVNYGAFLVLLSQFFGAGMNVSTRMLETPGTHGEPMHPFQILFARQSITTLITTIYALWTDSIPYFPLGPPGKVRLLLVSRGLFGFLGVFGLYFSLLYLPISEATILTFLSPIGSCIAFALLIPGETFSRQQMLAGLVSLLGVIFIARPTSLLGRHDSNPSMPELNATMAFNGTVSGSSLPAIPQPTPAQHLSAVGVAMVGVVGAIGAITSIRAIGQRAHALLSVNYFSAWCTFVSLVALLTVPSVKFRLPGNLLEWGLLSILGFAGFVMQLLLTKGMAYGGARASPKAVTSVDTGDLEMQTQDAGARAGSPRVRSTTLQGPEEAPKVKSSGAKATSMLYTQMLFALVSDKVIFGVTPDFWSWFGSGLILCGAIWVAADNGHKSSSANVRTDLSTERRVGSRRRDNGSYSEGVGLLSSFNDEGDGESNHRPP